MKLSAHQRVQLTSQLADDFLNHRPLRRTADVTDVDGATRRANRARLTLMTKTASVKTPGLIKNAFDTRRFNQDEVRNPRANLQYWQRGEEWISANLQVRVTRLARFIPALQELRNVYGKDNEWHQSYVRKLAEDMERILRIKEADNEIIEPQIAYLEQLIDARYRLSLNQLDTISIDQFKTAILSKDEELLKKGVNVQPALSTEAAISKTTETNVSQSIVNALFGQQALRQNGEKSVTRTVTITITDSVNE